jgi:hypothetical protein
MPLRTIANGFEIGPCPEELSELNETELAFVSPMGVHDDVFTFFGGARGVKGWHSFVKVALKHTVHGSHQINEMGEVIPNINCGGHVKQVCQGGKSRNQEKNNLPGPVLADTGKDAKATADNIEEADEFAVALPDDTRGEIDGDQKDSDECKKIVHNSLMVTSLF